ncbi:hypothetical protein ACQI5H_20040 [Mycobacterium heidelbergense]|uniref:hypothetical protein n=1 Tax=Mycobacterium heidelbergense TaxID=53376 RepID=UPI003CFA06A0
MALEPDIVAADKQRWLADHDEANRLVLKKAHDKADALRANLRAGHHLTPGERQFVKRVELIEAGWRELNAVAKQSGLPPARWLVFDPLAYRGDGRAVIVFGDDPYQPGTAVSGYIVRQPIRRLGYAQIDRVLDQLRLERQEGPAAAMVWIDKNARLPEGASRAAFYDAHGAFRVIREVIEETGKAPLTVNRRCPLPSPPAIERLAHTTALLLQSTAILGNHRTWEYNLDLTSDILLRVGDGHVSAGKIVTVADVWRELKRCFNDNFPIHGAPATLPNVGDQLPLEFRFFGQQLMKFPVEVTQSAKLGEEINIAFAALPGHIDGLDSAIHFRFYRKDGELHLGIRGYITEGPGAQPAPIGPPLREGYRLVARFVWQPYIDRLAVNIAKGKGFAPLGSIDQGAPSSRLPFSPYSPHDGPSTDYRKAVRARAASMPPNERENTHSWTGGAAEPGRLATPPDGAPPLGCGPRPQYQDPNETGAAPDADRDPATPPLGEDAHTGSKPAEAARTIVPRPATRLEAPKAQAAQPTSVKNTRVQQLRAALGSAMAEHEEPVLQAHENPADARGPHDERVPAGRGHAVEPSPPEINCVFDVCDQMSALHGREYIIEGAKATDRVVDPVLLFKAMRSDSEPVEDLADVFYRVKERGDGASAIVGFRWTKDKSQEAESHFIASKNMGGVVWVYDRLAGGWYKWPVFEETVQRVDERTGQLVEETRERPAPVRFMDTDPRTGEPSLNPNTGTPYRLPAWAEDLTKVDEEDLAKAAAYFGPEKEPENPLLDTAGTQNAAKSLGLAAGQGDDGGSGPADLSDVESALAQTALNARDEAPFEEAERLVGEAKSELHEVIMGIVARGDDGIAEIYRECWSQLNEAETSLLDGKNMLKHAAGIVDEATGDVSALIGHVGQKGESGASVEALQSSAGGITQALGHARDATRQAEHDLGQSNNYLSIAKDSLDRLSSNIQTQLATVREHLEQARDGLANMRDGVIAKAVDSIEIEARIRDTRALISQKEAKLEHARNVWNENEKAEDEIHDKLAANEEAIEAAEQGIQSSGRDKNLRNYHERRKDHFLAKEETLRQALAERQEIFYNTAAVVHKTTEELHRLKQLLERLENRMDQIRNEQQQLAEWESKYEERVRRHETNIPKIEELARQIDQIRTKAELARAPAGRTLEKATETLKSICTAIDAIPKVAARW